MLKRIVNVNETRRNPADMIEKQIKMRDHLIDTLMAILDNMGAERHGSHAIREAEDVFGDRFDRKFAFERELPEDEPLTSLWDSYARARGPTGRSKVS